MREFHYSQLKTIVECQFKHRHQEEDDYSGEPAKRGTAIHESIEKYLWQCMEQGVSRDEDAMEAIISRVVHPMCTGEEHAYAVECLRRFVNYFDAAVPDGWTRVPESRGRILVSERADGSYGFDPANEFDVDGGFEPDPLSDPMILYAGTIDDLVHKEGSSLAVIRDWKSDRYAPPPSAMKHDRQLRFYGLLAHTLTGAEHIKTELHWLSCGRVDVFEMDLDDIQAAADELWSLAQASMIVFSDDVAPQVSPGAGCATCRSLHRCPAAGKVIDVVLGYESDKGEGPMPVSSLYPIIYALKSNTEKVAKRQAGDEPIQLDGGDLLGFFPAERAVLYDNWWKIIEDTYGMDAHDIRRMSEEMGALNATSISKWVSKNSEAKLGEVKAAITYKQGYTKFEIKKGSA